MPMEILGSDDEVQTVLGWILDFAVRHECAELVQALPKTGHKPPTIAALALRQLQTSLLELAENPSPCFEEWQVTSFEKAMTEHSESAPESATKWLLELKERVVICLHAENKLRAAREALDAFFPGESPVLLNSILHDSSRRRPVGSTEFNQVYISRKVTAKSLQSLAQSLYSFVTEWIQGLPPCLLDQMVDKTTEEDFVNLADCENDELCPSTLEDPKVAVPLAANLRPHTQHDEDDETEEEEEEAVCARPTRTATRANRVQLEKQPLKVSRKSSRRRDPVADEPADNDEEAPETAVVLNLRSKSASLLKQGGVDPLEEARRAPHIPQGIKPRSRSKATSIVLEKCVSQPEWSGDEEEEEEASALPKLGAAPALVSFKPFKPLSEIGNHTAGKSKPARKGRKRVKWTPTEEDQLRKGVERFGQGNWADVLEQFDFNGIRTSVDLKDKWRNLNK